MTEEQSLAHMQPLLAACEHTEGDLSTVPLKFKSIHATNLKGMLLWYFKSVNKIL